MYIQKAIWIYMYIPCIYISMPIGMSICYAYRCICYVYRCISMFLVRWSGFQMDRLSKKRYILRYTMHSLVYIEMYHPLL